MVSQLKVIQGVTSKGKSSSKIPQAADKLDYLITFNQSITRAMARTIQDLSNGVFINVANLTLAHRDSYLEYVKAGIKQDMLASLRSPLHMSALFPDHIIAKAEEEIRHPFLHTPLPVTAQLDQVAHNNKLLCKFHRNLYLLEVLHQLLNKIAVELVKIKNP